MSDLHPPSPGAPPWQPGPGGYTSPRGPGGPPRAGGPRPGGPARPGRGPGGPDRRQGPAARTGGRAAVLVGALAGLVAGAASFLALAPSDHPASADGPSGAGATVTTSPGAGGTGGDAGAAGQAATPEEQPVHDLAAAYTQGDCTAIVAMTDAGYWGERFDAGDEAQAATACDAAVAAGEIGEVRVQETWILRTTANGTQVAAIASGWDVNVFFVRERDGAWRIYGAMLDPDVVEGGASAVGGDGGGSGSGGAADDLPAGRPATAPDDPPSGSGEFDDLARNCHAGLMVACDDLWWVAPRGSEHELYGTTCGGRRLGVFAGGHCERDFNRQLED